MSFYVTGLQDMVRIVSRPDKAPKDEDEEVFAEEDDEGGSDEGDDGNEGYSSSDGEFAEEAAELEPSGAVDGPVDMEIENGGPSTEDQVSVCFPALLASPSTLA
jgi:hypothetical protein